MGYRGWTVDTGDLRANGGNRSGGEAITIFEVRVQISRKGVYEKTYKKKLELGKHTLFSRGGSGRHRHPRRDGD